MTQMDMFEGDIHQGLLESCKKDCRLELENVQVSEVTRYKGFYNNLVPAVIYYKLLYTVLHGFPKGVVHSPLLLLVACTI